jgi:hypothetical protein
VTVWMIRKFVSSAIHPITLLIAATPSHRHNSPTLMTDPYSGYLRRGTRPLPPVPPTLLARADEVIE